MTTSRPITIATRGSALALVQANYILELCRKALPDLQFELKIIKTTGDKLQTISLNNPNQEVTKGLFTKELEVALLNGEADLAVHSLKDLPTELPPGLKLAAVSPRADVRDLLIYRNAAHHWASAQTPGAPVKRALQPHSLLRAFPSGAIIATSSTRRQAQLLAMRPDLKIIPIRGNVGTRLQKLADQPELDGLVLAAAGLERLHCRVQPDGRLQGSGFPQGLLATYLSTEEMLPCVGQGALGIETRSDDARTDSICEVLNDEQTLGCVTAERAFLHGMGGGCLSPVAAYADWQQGEIRVRAVSFRDEHFRRAEARGPANQAVILGTQLAKEMNAR
jgi:hydroxymethylbilane synthase